LLVIEISLSPKKSKLTNLLLKDELLKDELLKDELLKDELLKDELGKDVSVSSSKKKKTHELCIFFFELFVSCIY
jgi:hypothetical protein